MDEKSPIAIPAALATLTHNRWALPVLAEIARSRGAKFVTLSRRLGVSAPSLQRALARLDALDLVVKNPGYGHPMRPEYILGGVGEQVGSLPQEVVRWIETDVGAEVLKKWHLPVLLALRPEARRFSEVRRTLPPATPRAITMALKSHVNLGLVIRAVEPGYPPTPLYQPTDRALVGREPAWELGAILAS